MRDRDNAIGTTAPLVQIEYQEQIRPSLILWRGVSWAVTTNGIETIDTNPRLVIRKRQVCPTKDIDKVQNEIVHRLGREAAAPECFRQAWRQATRLFGAQSH